MTASRIVTTNTILTIADSPDDIAFKIFVDQTVKFSNGQGLRASPEVMTANGIVDIAPAFALSLVPLTLSGITKPQWAASFIDLFNYWKTTQGYQSTP